MTAQERRPPGRVANVSELHRAMAAAQPGDIIEMADGTWADAHIELSASARSDWPVTVRAQTPGRVKLTGTSSLQFNSPHIIVDGLHFVRTDPVDSATPVVEFRSEYGRLVNTAIDNYNPPEFNTRYHWVRFSGPHNVVDRCYFSGKNHQGPVVALGNRNARHNIVRYSLFENIPHAVPNGREIIQASAYGDSEELGPDGGFMLIEHNLFERADGEGAEIISLKSNRNIVRFNTVRATIGGFVGRSGNFNTFEDNIILGEHRPGTTGIRVSGQGHIVRNNYIARVAGPALNLFAGEYFVDEAGNVAGLTEKFAPILRKGTQYGVVPAYGHVKGGAFTGNTFVDNAGPDILVGGLYKNGWPARQRVLVPETNTITGNRIFSSREARTAVEIVAPETAPPLDTLTFQPNAIEKNAVSAAAAPAPFRRPLTREDVGPAWRRTLNMERVPAASFQMGTDPAQVDGLMARFSSRRRELYAPELPVRTVKVQAFYIDRTEVTNAEFKRFVESYPEWSRERIASDRHNGDYLNTWASGMYPMGEAEHPVTFITWDAAVAYCQSVGKRLPTEAEWEYAAGRGETEFPWGDTLPDATNANWSGAGLDKPSIVGRFPASRGLHDMAGNVWEFVQERWTDSYDASSKPAPDRRVIRGGSFGASAVNLRVRYRDSHPDLGAGPHVGFRCVRSER